MQLLIYNANTTIFPFNYQIGLIIFKMWQKMEDKYNLLTGSGKAIRVLQQKEKLEPEIIRYYIKQAIEL